MWDVSENSGNGTFLIKGSVPPDGYGDTSEDEDPLNVSENSENGTFLIKSSAPRDGYGDTSCLRMGSQTSQSNKSSFHHILKY